MVKQWGDRMVKQLGDNAHRGEVLFDGSQDGQAAHTRSAMEEDDNGDCLDREDREEHHEVYSEPGLRRRARRTRLHVFVCVRADKRQAWRHALLESSRPRHSFGATARPYPHSGHAVGDADTEPI